MPSWYSPDFGGCRVFSFSSTSSECSAGGGELKAEIACDMRPSLTSSVALRFLDFWDGATFVWIWVLPVAFAAHSTMKLPFDHAVRSSIAPFKADSVIRPPFLRTLLRVQTGSISSSRQAWSLFKSATRSDVSFSAFAKWCSRGTGITFSRGLLRVAMVSRSGRSCVDRAISLNPL